MLYTRRELGKLALATVPAAALAGRPLAAFAAKPDSKVAGVQIGLNVPYDFGNNMMSGDEVLDGCVKLGISAVELRSAAGGAIHGRARRVAGWTWPRRADAGTGGCPQDRGGRTAEMARVRSSEQSEGIPQEVRGCRGPHSDRQVRQHPQLQRSRARLRLRARQDAWRPRNLVRAAGRPGRGRSGSASSPTNTRS